MRTTWNLVPALLLAAQPALAYIGPGAGISFIGALGTWLLGILIALFAILFWPLRLLLRRLRRKPRNSPDTDESAAGTDQGG